MKVSELRAALEGLPDDMPVLVPSTDHSYRSPRSASAGDVGVFHDERRHPYYCVWFGPNANPGETVARAFVIID